MLGHGRGRFRGGRVEQMSVQPARHEPDGDDCPSSVGRARPSLRLVESSRRRSARDTCAQERILLRLTFSELVLIHKALQAVKTIGALPPQDDLLNDTMQMVDVTLNAFVM